MDKEAIARVNKALAIPYTGVISKGTTFCEEPFVTVREADLRAILALQSSEGERLREAVRASLEQNLGVGLVDARARSLIIANALAAFDATLSPAEPSPESREGVEYVIWSNEHRAWWAPNRCGYTSSLERAGRYDRAAAINIAHDARGGWCMAKQANKNPPEIAMPLADALAQDAKAPAHD